MKIAESTENNHPGLPVGSQRTEDFSKDTATSIWFPGFHCWDLTRLFTSVLSSLNPIPNTSPRGVQSRTPRGLNAPSVTNSSPCSRTRRAERWQGAGKCKSFWSKRKATISLDSNLFHSVALKKQTRGSLSTALRAAMHFKAHSFIISRFGLLCPWGLLSQI